MCVLLIYDVKYWPCTNPRVFVCFGSTPNNQLQCFSNVMLLRSDVWRLVDGSHVSSEPVADWLVGCLVKLLVVTINVGITLFFFIHSVLRRVGQSALIILVSCVALHSCEMVLMVSWAKIRLTAVAYCRSCGVKAMVVYAVCVVPYYLQSVFLQSVYISTVAMAAVMPGVHSMCMWPVAIDIGHREMLCLLYTNSEMVYVCVRVCVSVCVCV